jgi:leucyl aminopeptidase
MSFDLAETLSGKALPVFIADGGMPPKDVPADALAFAKASGFQMKEGEGTLLPDGKGGLSGCLFVSGGPGKAGLFGRLGTMLPKGAWRASRFLSVEEAVFAALGAYKFTRYRKGEDPARRLAVGPAAADAARIASACGWVRDLVNTPTNDMLPDALEAEARSLAKAHGARITVTTGDRLLAASFPMIHAVGRASSVAPRLIDLKWSPKTAGKAGAKPPLKVTLVGKGVCFDTGGLDIKPSSSMLLMKKDMGGAAHVLGLARMIMEAGRNVRLRVLIPAVENAISASAFRPGDVLTSRKGDTVEIGNTDAEGRLVLADALTLACEEKPDLLIDMATLTGAARVALGPDVPPFFTDDEGLAADMAAASAACEDPSWRLPLWKPYAAKLASKIADTNNVTTDGFAGSVTAALFLQRFVEPGIAWMHFDIFAWSPVAKPSCPAGAEAQIIRALDALIARRAA